MSLLENYKKESKTKAFALLKSSIEKVDKYQKEFLNHFKYTSISNATEELKKNGQDGGDDSIKKTVLMTLDVITSISQDIQTIETFIQLHFPKMEDGNNFGVTVQLQLLKQITDIQDNIVKQIESLSGYYTTKADVIEKCKLTSSSSITKTETKTSSKSTGETTKDGKTNNTNDGNSTEEKLITTTTTNTDNDPYYVYRKDSLIAVDTLYYTKAQRAFQSIFTSYIAVIDFLDKNQDKLEKPKGSGGTSGFSSMY